MVKYVVGPRTLLLRVLEIGVVLALFGALFLFVGRAVTSVPGMTVGDMVSFIQTYPVLSAGVAGLVVLYCAVDWPGSGGGGRIGHMGDSGP